MGKVYPCRTTSSSPCAATLSNGEMYTIWMKSLVANGNGYTVYDSNGRVVYRIDNYDCKCSSEVYLMDLKGSVLCTILKKKLLRFGNWDGYKCNGPTEKNEKPWFQVKSTCKFLKKDQKYDVLVGCDETKSGSCYKIGGLAEKAEFNITDSEGRVVAEVKRKQSECGVVLGEDVLSLKVERTVDHSLIMALVAVYGLLTHRM